ncbi:uncharacterized protein LOC100905177 [Galendromus occidentalis]|uniref:Uncharacterized protein LOC100905177 n=1 Tax=Galendromus occidentalis TaxID=34638 RepID=A0AAJ6VVY4_9ACAR|nr:uncharacterized protein LOC100905177 [Galendromus occidentalis]
MVAIDTIFGWFFNGLDSVDDSSAISTALLALHSAEKYPIQNNAKRGAELAAELEQQIDFLWDMERLGLTMEKDDDETEAKLERFVEETIEKRPDGNYTVSLPFRENVGSLGDNEKLARSCLSHFLKSYRENQKLIIAVDNDIKDCIASGFAEPAPQRTEGQPAHYLPIMAVAKKSSISKPELPKIRVVKNAAARSRDEASLNDVLHCGPSLLPEILKVLIFFRSHKAIVSDIQEAFLQFQINPKHRTLLRFFWPIGIGENPNAPVREFWGRSLEFGLVCSPFLHCAGLRYHLDSEIRNRPEDADGLQEVRNSFYMDDIFSGASDVLEGKHRVETLSQVFANGKFPLMKWATNSATRGTFMRNQFPEAQVTFQDSNFKMLGILWDQPQDKIGVFVDNALTQLRVEPPTKMSVLRGLSHIFDPLGVVVPISINFKILLQTLWSERRDWTEELSGENLQAFQLFRDQLEQAGSIRVDRLVSSHQGVVRRELHVFSDASLLSYGAVVYLKKFMEDRRARVTFMMAKARVKPLKGCWNIHRLELRS